MPLQKLIGNVYSVLVEILLWLLPITGAVVGHIAATSVLHDGNCCLWALLGIIAGLLADILLFGPVIILLNIRASLKTIENK